MKKPADLMPVPGVFVLLHNLSRKYYVGTCSDVRHRAAIWAHHFKKLHADPETYEMPVRNFPRYHGYEWTYVAFTQGETTDQVRAALEAKGFKAINEKSRVRGDVTFRGKTASIAEHARDAGVAYNTAYKRWTKGHSLEDILK